MKQILTGLKSYLRQCSFRIFLCGKFLLYLILGLLLIYEWSVIYYQLYCSYQFYQGFKQAQQRNLWNTKEGVKNRFIPILVPTCDRPHYLTQVLEGLNDVDGINETLVVVSQDCGQSLIRTVLLSAPSAIKILVLTHTPPYFSWPGYFLNKEYATAANIKFLLQFAFEYMMADDAILLESDLVPSVDFYRYHQWMQRTVFVSNISKILSVHSFNIHSTESSDPYSVFPRGFDSWGWSTARTRWPWLKNEWTHYNNWDITISRAAKRDGWICLIPKLSRTRMIGLKGINVNVYLPSEKKKFEEKMYMSTKPIDYHDKIPKIE